MTLTEIRDACIQKMVDNWSHSDTPMFYQNGTDPDLDTVGDHFGRFQIEFHDSKQANLSAVPFTREYGSIAIILFSKDGTGTRHDTLLLDELKQTFKLGSLGAIHTHPPRPGRAYEQHDGWQSIALVIPFFADSNA